VKQGERGFEYFLQDSEKLGLAAERGPAETIMQLLKKVLKGKSAA